MSLPRKKFKAVLFDLDGTLLDTASDLAQALNDVLVSLNRDVLPIDLLRGTVGKGAEGLLKLALDMGNDHPDFARRSDELLQHYEKCMLNTTQLFVGMDLVLQALEERNIPWGIVTNKPHRFTVKILDGLLLQHRAQCVVSGDTLQNKKPHPEPILYACKMLGVEPEECLYVGDAEIDMQASLAAGLTALTALYGYITEGEDPSSWKAHGYVRHPAEILEWVFEK
jgi:N-acetyl-D-muramate 6-phosphate phosphatase